MLECGRPVWAEINLKDIVHNYRQLKGLVKPSVQMMTVVKANAYGHGAVECAEALEEAGADYFGVAITKEAVLLREGGIAKPILVLGWTPVEDYQRALENRITLTIYSLQEAEELSRIARERKVQAIVHLKVDTGMGRIGLPADEKGLAQAARIISLPEVEVEGIFTHFSKADEKDKSYTVRQLKKFKDFCTALENKTGFKFRIKHAANSAALMSCPEAHFDLVRAGIALYGLKPSDEVLPKNIKLRQAMALRAKISHVKEVPAGFSISYGGRFVTERDSVIATLPLGYADGYSRLLSGKTQVLCRGMRANTIGRVCMDQFMFDATEIIPRVKRGDVVTLLGKDGDDYISVDELAGILGTINYEVVCMISSRVPRIYP